MICLFINLLLLSEQEPKLFCDRPTTATVRPDRKEETKYHCCTEQTAVIAKEYLSVRHIPVFCPDE